VLGRALQGNTPFHGGNRGSNPLGRASKNIKIAMTAVVAGAVSRLCPVDGFGSATGARRETRRCSETDSARLSFSSLAKPAGAQHQRTADSMALLAKLDTALKQR
jgi:hypothetical protein